MYQAAKSHRSSDVHNFSYLICHGSNWLDMAREENGIQDVIANLKDFSKVIWKESPVIMVSW